MEKVVKTKRGNRNKKDNGRSNGRSDDGRREVKYVYLASKKAVFLVVSEPKKSKYSYGVPIVPLHGYYRAKDGKKYTAKDLSDYYVVLNLDKDDGLVDEIRNGVKLVVVGYKEGEVFVVNSDGEDGEEG